MLRRTALVLASFLVGLLAACSGACSGASASEPPTLIFAAASLTEPFEALARAFERQHPEARVDLHCAGTAQLVVQAREGAPVDVFASADEASLRRIADEGILRDPPVVFARNRLAIVVPYGNPRGIASLADLARSDLRVLLCGPEVPAGRYAREVLSRASIEVRSVSDEPSVKAVVSKVRLGEVDAGIVYATDVTSATGVDAVAIPDEHAAVATYPIAVLTAGRNPARGEAFVRFVLSPAGREILTSFGFALP